MTQGRSEGGGIQEIELKLRMTPQALQRLRRLPVIRALAQGRSRSRRLSSTYYDTPDGFLAAARMAWRVRQDGSGIAQTLKVPSRVLQALDLPPPARKGRAAAKAGDRLEAIGAAEVAEGLASGLQSLAEFECPLETAAPSLERIDHEGLRRHLHAHGAAERLVPLFTTRFERRSLDLVMADSRIELALDEGEIRAGSGEDLRVEPLCEVELELKEGRSERLFELALLLAEKLDFQLEVRSKSARGQALLEGDKPQPVIAAALDLPEDIDGAEAFETMVRDALGQLRANEPAVRLAEDPEALHQYRVALRRLRALLSLFKDSLEPGAATFLRSELLWLQQATGTARDWDVFLIETLGPLRRRLPDEPDLEPLADACEAARQAAGRDARALLDTPRYSRLLLRLQLLLCNGGWRREPAPDEDDPLRQPARLLAGRLLGRAAGKLDKLGRGRRDRREAELHEIRLVAKKLRYAVDFFRSLYPKKQTKLYAKRLKQLQDRLGSLNDAVVARQLIGDLEAPERAAGMVIGWQAARIEADLPHCEKVWRAYKAAKPFWS